jgi:hypothetical protein
MSSQIVRHFTTTTNRIRFSQNAIRRAAEYNADAIMAQFTLDLGLVSPQTEVQQRIVA